MDYLYENLGDERFQEFCSTIIAKEFPNSQAFPTGQPDGGRDSTAYYMSSTAKEFIVFQVKFVRNPNTIQDVHKWFTETIQGEAEKIDKLIPRGAKGFYLLTNVRGTAHLDTGSKDKVNKILEEKIKVPSICWWRDDLSRLFEKDPLFKWTYPEILSGQDVLNGLLFDNINESKERRESVIKSYLTDQYEIDNEVKFKQIDLQNRLLNLFTDVPIRIKKFDPKNKSLRHVLGSLGYHRILSTPEDFGYIEERSNLGAAQFLLHPKVQKEIERVLLEGGPGQGKSTISQYVCQAHRVRLLNKSSDIELLPDSIIKSPIRLPFKIDLRDIAAWVERKNPYEGTVNDEYFNSNWKNSLESFLVAHVFYHSKLEEFTSADFIAVCKFSSILFVFDGFDEIANISVRREVIDFINKGLTRISVNSKSIQIIITSRPAAFSDAVEFSVESYPHFELTDITPPIINDYVEKWIKASKIGSRDASELRKLIKEKISMPHLKDLAKSPMQLAIFISLLRTKGQSLPNKRTALYDSYIELFFDRESEKNSLIRDKRDLIINIHQYLAWLLHSEAEQYKNSGRIQVSELNDRLKNYLTQEGHKTDIADQLFDAMKERVCALVSRVQGTFEFEVQPLREYFCAKYLYESAPHSSVGNEKPGTKPDRFHVILRSFYWQNVVRFFAGCADAGELDMLIQELKELQNDRLLQYTNYPRTITSQILSDYVFSQKPLKLREVVKIILVGISTGSIINQDSRIASGEPLILPNECGKNEVVEECFYQLAKFKNNDCATELIGILNNNEHHNLEKWTEISNSLSGERLTIWFEYAYRLQLIHKIDESSLIKILEEGDRSQTNKRLQIAINGNRLGLIIKNYALKQKVFSSILKGEISVFQRKGIDNSLAALTLILHPGILSHAIRVENKNENFLNYLTEFIDRKNSPTQTILTDFEATDEIDNIVLDFLKSLNHIFVTPLAHFKDRIEYWDNLVELGRSSLQDNWCFYLIATIASGIRSKGETFDDHDDLHNNEQSLCKRVRCARMKSGNIRYWQALFLSNQNKLFVLLIFFTWATPKTIVYLLAELSAQLAELDEEEFLVLSKSLSVTTSLSIFSRSQQRYVENAVNEAQVPDNIKYIISFRFGEENTQKFIFNSIKDFNSAIEDINELKFEHLIHEYFIDPKKVELLAKIKTLYKKINRYNERYFHRYRLNSHVEIPYDIAQSIMSECSDYPKIISSSAERSCRLYAIQQTKPVGEIAKNERWFDNV